MNKIYVSNQKYNIIINDLIKKAKLFFKDKLINITLGGSGGKDDIIDNWSDLDMYIVLKLYDYKTIIIFNKELLKYEVHIGITYYTKNDILQKNIDFKTYVMIYEKYNYNVNPTLYGNEIYKKMIPSFDMIKSNDKLSLVNNLNQLKRDIINQIDLTDSKKLYNYIKKLTIVVKCILTQQNYFEYGYKNVFDKFKKNSKIIGINCFNNIYILDYITQKNNNTKDLIKFTNDLILNLHNYIKNK